MLSEIFKNELDKKAAKKASQEGIGFSLKRINQKPKVNFNDENLVEYHPIPARDPSIRTPLLGGKKETNSTLGDFCKKLSQCFTKGERE